MAIDALYELMSRGRVSDSGPLNVIDEDADKCCRRNAPKSQLWKRTDERAAWECPECGTRFEIAAVSEGMRYWRIVPQVVIVRPR